MTGFLSEDWFAELAGRLAEAGPLGEPTVRLALGQLVTDAPGGELGWTVHLGGGVPTRVERGVDGADVVLVEDLAAAEAIATGTPAAQLLSAGRVKLRGSVSALLAGAELLAALGEALAGLHG